MEATESVSKEIIAVSSKEPANFLTSLQALTSSIPALTIPQVKDDKITVKPKAKRGRKKRVPLKPGHQPILPKVFAIQLAPQAGVIAPVTTIVKPAVFQNTVNNLAAPVTNQPCIESSIQNASVPNKNTEKKLGIRPNIQPRGKTKTQEESVELVVNTQYTTDNVDPGQIHPESLSLTCGEFPKLNQKRLVHNAAEKKRKERINGWISKIATVLFKFCPEKQHKIYILEKAYDFIVEKSQSQKMKSVSQDAFTQSDHAQESTIQDLVGKIAELESLVDVLLQIIHKYKIPAPSSLFKSRYVKEKIGANTTSNEDLVGIRISDANKNNDFLHDRPNLNASSVDSNQSNPVCELIVEMRDPTIAVSSNVPSSLPLQSCASDQNCAMITVVNEPVCLQPGLGSQADIPVPDTFINMMKSPAIAVTEAHAALIGPPSSTHNQAIMGQATLVNASQFVAPASVPPVCVGATAKSVTIPNVATANLVDECRISSTNFSPPTDQNMQVVMQNNARKDIHQSTTTTNVVNGGSFQQNSPRHNSKEQGPIVSCPIVSVANIHPSNVEVFSKAPTMESQMFVIKNLVQPRPKNFLFTQSLPLADTPSRSNENMVDEIAKSVHRSNCGYLTPIQQDITAQTDSGNILHEQVLSSSDGRILPTVLNANNPATYPVLRIETSSVLPSQIHVQKPSLQNTSLKNPNPQVISSKKTSTKGPSNGSKKAQNFAIDFEGEKNPAIASQHQTLNALSSIQTSHTVTSLLGNIVTSPTENSALSIEAILADKPKTQKDAETQPMQGSKRAKQQINNTSDKTSHPLPQNLSRNNSSNRKRPSTSRTQSKQSNSETTNPVTIVTQSTVSTRPSSNKPLLAKPPTKRAKRSTGQYQGRNDVAIAFSDVEYSTVSVSIDVVAAGTASRAVAANRIRNDERTRQKKQNVDIAQASAAPTQRRGDSTMPKAQNFVSLARKDHRPKNRGNNSLGQFSAESLLRSNSSSTAQAFLGDADQAGSLPTILNIFAPASVGNMVSQLPVSTNNQNFGNNSTFPTIQSTFSNFSAETLIGGPIENHSSISHGINAAPNANDSSLVHAEQQNLFTDFSTDALLAGTESSLSYGIDNIMSRNDAVASSTCGSPNWLQANAFIDNSPIRGNFNPGFNFLETPNGPHGYSSSATNANFSTPIKWRQDMGRIDESIGNISSSAVVGGGNWGLNILSTPQKKTRNSQTKGDGQRNKIARNQPNNKRGPSFGDFLLVDSVT